MVYSDPFNANMTQMFARLFQDSLNEYTYAADLAGLSYGLSSGYAEFYVRFYKLLLQY